MKIEFIRKHRSKEIGIVEDVPDRVAHRFVNKGMAKFVIEKPKIKSKRKSKAKKNANRWGK